MACSFQKKCKKGFDQICNVKSGKKYSGKKLKVKKPKIR